MPISLSVDGCIRVVPLHNPSQLRPATADGSAPLPRLTYRNGPLLASVRVYTIFWGDAWKNASTGLVLSLNDFFKFVVTSPLIDQLAEYNVPHQKIVHGSFLGTKIVAPPAPRTTVSDSEIQHFLQQELSTDHSIPRPTPNTLYFVFTPPGVKVRMRGGSSCSAFCGYHSNIDSSLFYAVMPYPGCPGCLGGMNVLDALTGTSSHELCEAITDAIPGTGWYDDDNGEIADICPWKFKKIGPWNVQLEWSNKAGKCI